MGLLQESVIYLLAAIIMVTVSRRLGFGSVLGYLAAGILIGPFGIALIRDPEHILHFAELGSRLPVVHCRPRVTAVTTLGAAKNGVWTWLGASRAQLHVVIAILAWSLGLATTPAIVIGLILALSSTAFVLQMLAEKNELTTSHGRAAFSILLFQDLAAIPLIAILPTLGASSGDGFDIVQAGVMAATIIGLIVGGRFLLRPILQIAAASKIPEIFTATALLVVIGAALLMQFRRHVDGAWCIHCRNATCRLRVPASTRSGYRAF